MRIFMLISTFDCLHRSRVQPARNLHLQQFFHHQPSCIPLRKKGFVHLAVIFGLVNDGFVYLFGLNGLTKIWMRKELNMEKGLSDQI